MLKGLMAKLDPSRLYQSNSADGRGVSSHGPYFWRSPRYYYAFNESFKTEVGIDVGAYDRVDPGDDAARRIGRRSTTTGRSMTWPRVRSGAMSIRYGWRSGMARFAILRTSCARRNWRTTRRIAAMYEGRNAQMFKTTTGVITWMSHPAQPSFVWQLYHYDLEAHSSLFAAKKAAETVHVQLNESNGDVQVINNLPVAMTGRVHLAIYNLDGSVALQRDFDVSAAASVAAKVGAVEWPAGLSAVHFVKLELRDAEGKLASENFYWKALPEHQNDLTALNSLPAVGLEVTVARRDVAGRSFFDLTLRNPGRQIALMTHLQLRRKKSGERVLPVYASDNYLSLVGGETKTVTIEVATADLGGEDGLVAVDGWNVGVAAASLVRGNVVVNPGAQVEHWPVTGLPMISIN